MTDKLKPGTRIQFIKTLKEMTCEGYPEILYVHDGEYGTIVKAVKEERYWVITDDCPKYFIASKDDFKVM